ncbi:MULTISPECIES: lipopolysaccharide biosynthesis protein [Pseudoalteromonas]|uniref:Lipopolysaccharide biosynthesis protein n=1 Tax=Pseudoalteromonas amylolytica TaxID=1859457 RepID=A0A1S1MTS0_9GAMM|nr:MULTISPECIES: lipopolysaccharide biosynthesis protein [Pseudoalteromonas]OHU84931.1 lipopolysaccharide biosynthesis protein [Pseudoalteromonas sp. JW3]OHU90118.1 lipopolysaccharide biosynthesis protein [Pseudoalteromonas amylolytica]
MLEKKTLFSVIYSFVEQLARRGITVLVTLVLAYFLTPDEYGLVAMMALFLTLGQTLMESGFRSALIRKETLTQVDTNTAFFVSLAVAILSVTLLFFCAPVIANFYQKQELTLMIRVSSLSLIFNSLHVVQMAMLSREMQFKLILRANFPAVFISGVSAVLLAYMGFGVWALIAQILITAILTATFLWWQSKWRPSLSFSMVSLREIYSYGYKILLSSILDTFYKNFTVMVIAKVLTAGVAGLYFFADRVRELLVSQLINSIQTVTFPALSSIQNDITRLKNGYQRVMSIMTFLVFPVLITLCALANLIFEALLPPKWLPAVPYLQIMCLTSIAIPLASININIMKVKGRSDWFLYVELCKVLLGLTALFFTYEKGVIAILLGQLASQYIVYFPSVMFANRLVDYPLREQFSDFAPSLFIAMFTGIVVWCLQQYVTFSAWFELLLFGTVSIVMYIALAILFRLTAAKQTLQMFKNAKVKNS